MWSIERKGERSYPYHMQLTQLGQRKTEKIDSVIRHFGQPKTSVKEDEDGKMAR